MACPPLSFPLPPSLPLLFPFFPSFVPLPLSLLAPSSSLRSRPPLFQLESLEDHCKMLELGLGPGRAPVEIDFGAI